MTAMRGGPGGRGRSRRRALAPAVLVVGVIGQVGIACESPCDQPFRAVAAEDSPNGEPFVEPWPVSGTPRPAVTRPLDTDGDGTTDVAELVDDRTLTVHRSTGDLVLTVPEPLSIREDPQAMDVTVGDIDGDGRSDVIVPVGPPPVPGERGESTWYLVSGATADGTHALADVAARPWPTGATPRSVLVGDVDGDGRDDLAAEGGDPPYALRVWSGADVDLTPGAAAPASPTYEPPGRYEATVPLDGRDAIALQSFDEEGGPSEVVLWLPEATWRFSTVAEGVNAPGGMAWVSPAVVGEGDDTWMTVTYIYRTIAQRWAWDLDDPCAGTGA